LARKRHQLLQESWLKEFWDQLKAKWKSGAIEVHVGGPRGPLFTFEEVDGDDMLEEMPSEDTEVEVSKEFEEEEEEESEEGEEEEEESEEGEEEESEETPAETGEPNGSWTKSQISDWLLVNVAFDEAPEKSELMKLKKDELLEYV
jgi:hypothetical protein